MDYDKLIERLRTDSLYADKASLEIMDLCMDAATSIEASWHENQALRGLINGLDAELSHVRADLARVTAERDAAISDVEALMWFSGEGCRICAHAVEVHKEPYVRLDCDREEGTDCSPKWRGIKED